MSNYIQMILPLIIIFFLLLPNNINAGECLQNPDAYIKDIEAIISRSDSNESNGILQSLFCLLGSIVYHENGYEYFASESVLKKINTYTKKNEQKIYSVLPQLLNHPNENIRCYATGVLAYYQWPESFEYLSKCCNDRPTRKAVLYAILGDKRAIPWIIEQYKIIDRKYKAKPIYSYRAKMIYLNSLYHLADYSALPFIDKIIKKPRPDNIKGRAIKVKNKIIASSDNIHLTKKLMALQMSEIDRKVQL